MSVLGQVGHLVIDTGPVCLWTDNVLEKTGRDYLFAEKTPSLTALSARVSGRGKPTSVNTVHSASKPRKTGRATAGTRCFAAGVPTSAAVGSTGRPPW